MPIYHIPDNYVFEVDRLMEELRVYKVEKLRNIREINRGKFATIQDLSSVNTISANDLNKILKYVKHELSIRDLPGKYNDKKDFTDRKELTLDDILKDFNK